MNVLFVVGVALFAASTVAYLASLWRSSPALVRAAHWLLGVTVVGWTALMLSWIGHIGVENQTQVWLGLSALGLSVLYLGLLRKYPIGALGSVVSALSTLLALLALLVSHRSVDVVHGPLRDWLLRVHIGLAFIGITAFAFATSVSVVYLLQARMLKQKTKTELRRRLPPLDVLDRLSLRGIIVGFPFYTVALLLGSAEALRADPTPSIRGVYVLAVISWVIYGVVLQARLTAGWRGRRAAILTMAGLVVALGVVAQYSLGRM